MSTDFEWYFDDELPQEGPEGKDPRPRLWRRWLIWGLLLLLVAGGAYAWWRQRQGTLAQVEAQVEQVARLELGALVDGDSELYLGLQDSADAAWRDAQAAYIKTGGLPLPIRGMLSIRTSIRGARVVGDLARVRIEYAVTLSSGRDATFGAVRFYRFTESGRWVHTKAPSDYAGPSSSLREDSLEVRVREEDADWVGPMVSGLESLVSSYCDLASCELDLPLTLDLGATLEEAAVAEDLILPAPFLLGAPEDEAAQRVWKAGLYDFLLSRLIALEIGSPPPSVHSGQALRDRLHAWFQGQLGLSQPASPDLELVWEALDTGAWIPLWELWLISPDDARRPLAEAEIDLLLAFIEREHGASAVARLPRALHDASHPGEAIADLVRDPWWVLRRRYLAYVREVIAGQSDHLTAFSSYDVIVQCWRSVESASFGAIWGLRLDDSQRVLLSMGSEVGDLSPVSWAPDGEQLLAMGRGSGGFEFYLLRRDGSGPQRLSMVPHDAEPVGSALLGGSGWSPDGTHLAFRVPGRPVAGGVVDLRTGRRAEFDGDFVAWSPDNSRLIHAQSTLWRWLPDVRVRTFHVWDRATRRERPVGQGYAATWSPDGDHIAIVTVGPAVRVYDTTSGETTTLLDEASLRQTLGFTPRPSSISGRPFELAWSPTGDWIALGATRLAAGGFEEGLTMVVGEGDRRLVSKQDGGMLGLAWSPDGQSLATFTFDPDAFRTVVTDVRGNSLFEGTGSSISWSPAGRYIAVGQGHGAPSLSVLDLGAGKWQELHVQGDCRPLVWNPDAPLGKPMGRARMPKPWMP